LKIWKQELIRMGGYLTNHGELELKRAQTILHGLAQREDDIFRKRREGLSIPVPQMKSQSLIIIST
jgi:5'-3' exoribonuclease 2